MVPSLSIGSRTPARRAPAGLYCELTEVKNGSSQLVEKFDGAVSGGFRSTRVGTEARERSRESGRPAKELENPACRRSGRGRERGTAQAPGRRMEEATVARSLRRAAPRRHRASRDEPARPRKAPGGVRLRRLQPAAFHFGDEIRQRHRMAEFFHHDIRRVRDNDRPEALHGAYRIPLRALRRTPRPHLRRWAPTDWPALLQQRRGAAI